MKMYGNPKRYNLRGVYHPLGEYTHHAQAFKRAQYVPDGKFHHKARKLEHTAPRGFRSDTFHTELLLESQNADK